ncbi:unnamed protein product [Effrenium voratum]|nr:unnamed protein product [Effrenium voratum]CAJ1418177.1 unnamed protein product [Effrenium voratum]
MDFAPASAARRSRPVLAELWCAERAASAAELRALQAQARRLADGQLRRGDLVVVVNPRRRLHGRVCTVVYVDSSEMEVEAIEDVELSRDMSAEICVKAKGACSGQKLKPRDVAQLPWPGWRRPPRPMTEQHLIEQDWDKLSDKRFSPGRLNATWKAMDGTQRRHYRQLSAAAVEAHEHMMLWRFRILSVLKEMLRRSPKPPLNAYALFTQRKPKGGPPWEEVKEEFQRKAAEENSRRLKERQLWMEVLLGGSWSCERSAFFPPSARRCLLTVLLCQKKSSSALSRISAYLWLEHIFPFIPCYWFAKVG